MDHREIALKLIEAERKRSPIDPLTSTYQGLSVNDAYKVQLEGVKIKIGLGRKVIGKKIGLTSKAMQDLLGVKEPDYGHLLDDMLILQGQPCKREDLIQPKVEGEIAFVLGDTLKGPGVTMTDVLKATEFVIPAIEIVDSRIRDWKIKLEDTIADNASSARFILGSKAVPVKNLDLRLIGMILEKNGRVMSTGAGAAVWGHPAAAVAWLANKLAEFGVALEAGEIILSGAVTAALDASKGDVFTVAFYELGSVTVYFE
ncbi:MAG: fumarylacetoacetate hydrolase family protein [Synergistetes bacterium]|nr:fumarylacetoacetate hydrolase family protein [Synergistota bacterium]MCX8127128.1 fumarylacetoacetate hydrolase family protein [Synergistota bacterium]MDW8191985.1 fumarylacetoacetate hydrolase family protein [Synergistota bacterium]